MIQTHRPDNKVHRVFFALWPNDEVRQKIHKQIYPVFDHPQGHKVPRHNWHITLAFLGNVSEEIYTCIQQQADNVIGESFELTLDMLGHWSRSKLAWLGCSHVPDALFALVNNMNVQLKPCHYEPEYKDYEAHMTLMRKVTRKPKPFEFKPIIWEVNQFVLVESQVDNTGSTYKIVKSWILP